MGRESAEIKVVVSLSKHNSEEDILDEIAWEELKSQVHNLIAEREFERLRPMVF